MFEFVKKLLGGSNDAALKKLQKTVDAVEALQDAGFNLPHTCTIPVFGFGNTPDVQNLLSTDAITGTVRTDNTAITDALFTVLQTVCGKHTIAHAIAALSSDSRFYVTEDCLSRLCLTCYPVD